jgi:transglutaminase-like putative cysteine protease
MRTAPTPCHRNPALYSNGTTPASERYPGLIAPTPQSSTLPRIQELAVYVLIVGTFLLVATTDGLAWPTLLFCLVIALLRIAGLTLSTNAGCATLLLVAAAAPLYWFFFRNIASLNIKDFLLAVLMVFLLSAQTGRDFAAVSSYCIWIMMASLFPSSGPQQWFILAILFSWFLIVQCLNELRRNRDQLKAWHGLDGWRLLRPLASFGLLMVLGIGIVAGGLYLLLPRNPIAAFQFNFQPLRRLVGFSGSVRLGEIGQLQDDRTPAFRVRFLSGTPPPIVRWRGAALSDFNGSAWTNTLETWHEFPNQGKIVLASDDQRRKPGPRLFYEIQTLAAMDRVLFTTGIPEYIYLPQGRLRKNAESAFRQISLEYTLPTYSFSGFLDPTMHPVAAETSGPLTQPLRQRYLRLPGVNPRIRELAEVVAAKLTDPAGIANRIETHLKTKYAYSLESNITGREPLVDFLFNTRAGHCEYFASAMAVMLRTLKIPTRVVTGFYASLPEPIDSWYVIRSSNAHSWVEVWIESKGWVVFDPTPAGGNQPQLSATMKWLIQMQDRFVVMSEEWMGGAAGVKRPNITRPEISWPWFLATISISLAWLLWQKRNNQLAAPHPATQLFKRYLKASKRKRALSQTARELEQTEFTALYEKARFSRDPQALYLLRQGLNKFLKR